MEGDPRRRSVFVIPALAAIAGLSACAAPVRTATIDVTLQEWAVVPATVSMTPGMVTFRVNNAGPNEIHELIVLRTDLGPGALPTTPVGSVDEAGAGITVVGEMTSLEPGGSGSLTLDLAPGAYVFVCNVVEDQKIHYALGMRTPVQVGQ
jgi:uncharacterized cupredoxin-like copper-binding protein